MDSSIQWDERLDRVVSVLYWLTLALGVFLAFYQLGTIPSVYAAVGICGSFVALNSAVPRSIARRTLVREAIIVTGSVATMTAVGLTGTLDSPFLLLALIPVLYSAVNAGFRAGLGAAALSIGILTSLVLPLADPNWVDLVQWVVLFLLVAITFGYANRLLLHQGHEFALLVRASAETTSRIERLDTAHQLLTKLAAQAESAELNPMGVGAAALDSVRSVVLFDAATMTLATDGGPVVVSTAGTPSQAQTRASIPLKVGEREVGMLVLSTEHPLTRHQEESIAAVVQPAALAFANVLLLQSIARQAIREERTRLARGLHDEIGPSLASLGLALDLAALQHPAEPALGVHLQQLRSSVGQLVEDVRTTVSDLRSPDDSPSLRESVMRLINERPGEGPSILFQVDERQSPRPSIVADVNAIVIEATRNAIHHSNASTIHIRGSVDFESGTIEIHDNGRGFDVSGVEAGHFGLIGIRERAAGIGATISVVSETGGTSVTLKWGKK